MSAQTPTEPITMLVADDHPTTREGLVLILDNEDGLLVVAQAGDGEEAVAQYRRHRPDVVLMDLHMPRMGGVGATEAIRAEFPGARVLLLTTYDGDEDIHRGLRAGAMAFLLKDTPVEEVLRAVRAVHEGGTYISAGVGARLARTLRTPQLTPREADVLRCVAEGLSNKAAAKRLGIGEGTVKSHLNAAAAKLGAANRTEVALLAVRHGLLRR